MDPEGTVVDSLADPRAKGTTIIAGAPATFLELIEASKNEISKAVSLPKLRTCMYAGSPASSTLSERIQELLGVALINNYGCTEACGAIAITKPNGVSCGNPIEVLSGWEVRVTGVDGNQVPDGEQGELWLRGSNLMTKYYRESANPFTADGWFPTGDIATISRSTADIELTLVGRHKETIIRGGQNIHPKEVESAILLYPGIKDVAVAGIEHKLFGEVPAAFIVKPGDIDLDLVALIAVCRKALPDYKIPTGTECPLSVYGIR
ncbi:polyketide synthetase [Lecanicillium sp. MT-2017a]|nr:polyketide synthetase [Lecanicillium sp. MT-2017a]